MPQGKLYPFLQPVVSTSAEVGNEVSACVGTSSVCLECDISRVKYGECNLEANKISAET